MSFLLSNLFLKLLRSAIVCMHRFQYMAMADNIQRFMPLPDDRLPGRCQTLAYPEAVLLVNPKMPGLKGEVLLLQQFYWENWWEECFKHFIKLLIIDFSSFLYWPLWIGKKVNSFPYNCVIKRVFCFNLLTSGG